MTKPSNYLSLELSKALHEKGVRIESEFAWFGDPNHITEDNTVWVWIATAIPINNEEADNRSDIGTSEPLCAAPTATEIGHWLKTEYSPLHNSFIWWYMWERPDLKMSMETPDVWGYFILSLLDKGIIQPITA